MFEKQKLFKVEDYIKMGEFLNLFVFRILWGGMMCTYYIRSKMSCFLNIAFHCRTINLPLCLVFFGVFFSARLLSVLRGHSVFHPCHNGQIFTSNFEGFSIQDFICYIYFPVLILKKEPVFYLLNVQC